jgi:hypothetical protein
MLGASAPKVASLGHLSPTGTTSAGHPRQCPRRRCRVPLSVVRREERGLVLVLRRHQAVIVTPQLVLLSRLGWPHDRCPVLPPDLEAAAAAPEWREVEADRLWAARTESLGLGGGLCRRGRDLLVTQLLALGRGAVRGEVPV